MIIKYKNIAILAIVLLTASCSESFLDINPEQSVAAESAVVDQITLQTALNGAYSKLQSNDYYGRTMYVIPELMADNLYLSSRNTGRYLEYETFVVSERNGEAEGLWEKGYQVIVNATRAIEGGKTLQGTTPTKQNAINQLIGEAHILRALAHFDLVRMFAQPYNFTADASHIGIPIITEVNIVQTSPKRNTVKEVYTQINKDLTAALGLMQAQKGKGVFSIGAAKGLMARVALYQDDKINAIKYSSEVIATGGYSLIANKDYPTLWSTKLNNETLFEIVNTIADNEGSNSLGHFFSVAGYADALVPTELYDLYGSQDARRTAITSGAKPGAEKNAFFVNKFPKGTLSDDNIKILRLAEQYLIRAEAYAKEGENTLAQNDLNVIVKRANPNALNATETGPALLNRILEERRKELAFEGHRLFDLNRNKKDVKIIQSEKSMTVSYPNDKFILPIPLKEINSNPNIKPQNTGY
ncbi:RagB/SusD family nutrient uptake outer membrane protein [Flavobacterium sp. K5-23]|uniref:RagB/SusD family nutrient uptake outer membrane protein n=1 Tax=Flavobacterium sp. K5-23 TaxID=2746225 RepID=UPI00200D3001|nr:RagB/SusD family nutrient uptake outer membrane protein [Flavobacterium sp. K5-23]UQD55828.1 RagB/SusD family nutrient uptake outer membrane protein [Flavobacterium sp. K5-23]